MATWGVGPPGRHTEADASPFISPSMAKRSDDFPAATRPQTATNSPGMGPIFVPKATDGLAMGPWLAHFVMLSSPTKSFCTAFGNLRLALGTDQSSGGWWHCVKSCHGCEEFSELSRCLDPCCRHAGPLDRCQNLLGTSHGARCKEDTGNCVTIWAWEQNDDGKSLQSFAKDTFTYFCQGLLRLQCSPHTFIALKITSVSFNFEKKKHFPKQLKKSNNSPFQSEKPLDTKAFNRRKAVRPSTTAEKPMATPPSGARTMPTVVKMKKTLSADNSLPCKCILRIREMCRFQQWMK